MTLEPLINVHKQRLISSIVAGFMNAQQLTSKYKFVTERKLHQRCMKMRAVDMVCLFQLSCNNWTDDALTGHFAPAEPNGSMRLMNIMLFLDTVIFVYCSFLASLFLVWLGLCFSYL